MASGDSLLVFLPEMNRPPDDDIATLDQIVTSSTDEPDNVAACLDFDDGATNEFAQFAGVMPEHYGGGGLTCTIIWRSASATSGVCRWEIAFKSITDDVDDHDSKASAAANAVNATTASAAGEFDYSNITFTDGADMDSVAAGEYFELRLNRDSADAADTLVGDAEFMALHITET